MATLQELVMEDFGLTGNVKTASANDDSIEALAAQFGYDFGKEAAEDKEDEKEDEKEGEKKEASDLGSYFETLFPEESEKTAAEMEKNAYEENLGARAYDFFQMRWDARVEKLAAEIASASTKADHEGNVHEDPTVPQASKTNRPANASDKIDTAAVVTDEVSAKNDEKTVGYFQQKHAALEALAARKAMILSQLED